MDINFLTVEDFAIKIKMHPTTVRRCIKEGKIFASRLSMGKRAPYRIPETELERIYLQGMCEKSERKK